MRASRLETILTKLSLIKTTTGSEFQILIIIDYAFIPPRTIFTHSVSSPIVTYTMFAFGCRVPGCGVFFNTSTFTPLGMVTCSLVCPEYSTLLESL